VVMVVVVVVPPPVVVVVHNLVAMWMLSMLSTLPHLPDLELGAVDICTKSVLRVLEKQPSHLLFWSDNIRLGQTRQRTKPQSPAI